MDGDDFSRATRLGRAVAEAVVHASEGGEFNPITTALLIDQLVESSAGISSLPAILSLLEDLRATPLLISTRVEESCARVDQAAHGSESGMLDLHFGLVAQSAILRGETDPTKIVESFFRALIERYVIMGRGGLVEVHGARHIGRARELTESVVVAAAAEMIRRPNARHLRLVSGHRSFDRLPTA